MLADIDQQKKNQMLSAGNAAGLAEAGDMTGLDRLYQNGQYDECLTLAEK